MSNKNNFELISRRSLLRSAVSLGAAAVAAPVLAQDALQDIISAPRRGAWDDQFDASAASRATVNVVSNNPVLGSQAPGYIQQAIGEYQGIVSNGGWPRVTPGQAGLRIGNADPAVQQLRQRLMISGDLARNAGMSTSFDSYVDSAVKRFQVRHGLPADGVLGEFTLKALNVPADTRLMQLQTNLVRVQSMAGDLGIRHVMVNIPAAYIEAVESDRVCAIQPSSAVSTARPIL